MNTLEQAVELAQKEASNTQEDQSIYKSGNDYKFIPSRKCPKGSAVRVVRFAGGDQYKDVLQDSGNKQPIVVSKKSGASKAR